MQKKRTIDSVLADAERVAQVWEENPKFSMGDLTLEAFKAHMTKLRDLRQSRDETRTTLSRMIDETNDQLNLLDGLNVRGRSGAKAIFGPDSPQYAQVGGTRQSERKAATRKTKTTQG